MQTVFVESCDGSHHNKICFTSCKDHTSVAAQLAWLLLVLALGFSRFHKSIKGVLRSVVLLGRRLGLLLSFGVTIPVNVVEIQFPRLRLVPAGTVRATMVVVWAYSESFSIGVPMQEGFVEKSTRGKEPGVFFCTIVLVVFIVQIVSQDQVLDTLLFLSFCGLLRLHRDGEMRVGRQLDRTSLENDFASGKPPYCTMNTLSAQGRNLPAGDCLSSS
jgi:hypothetical protein